jgi:hypothetical protein
MSGLSKTTMRIDKNATADAQGITGGHKSREL